MKKLLTILLLACGVGVAAQTATAQKRKTNHTVSAQKKKTTTTKPTQQGSATITAKQAELAALESELEQAFIRWEYLEQLQAGTWQA